MFPIWIREFQLVNFYSWKKIKWSFLFDSLECVDIRQSCYTDVFRSKSEIDFCLKALFMSNLFCEDELHIITEILGEHLLTLNLTNQ